MCRCGNPALWMVEANLLELNPDVRARKLMAKQEGYTIDDDPFIHIELLLASALAKAYAYYAMLAEDAIKTALEVKPLSKARVEDALAEANKILGNTIDNATLEKVGSYIDDLISKGANDAQKEAPKDAKPAEDNNDNTDNQDQSERFANVPEGVLALLAGSALLKGDYSVADDTILADIPEVDDVFLGMVASAKYYSNAHFNDVIMPELQQRISDLIDSGDESGISDIIDYLGERLADVPYWRVVANAAASRAYHYGFMKAGDLLGATAYKVVAILDDRTSEICDYLGTAGPDGGGIEFPISSGIDQVEEIAGAPSADDVKDISPWLPADEIVGASAEELMDLGVMTPPYHANCRSSLTLVYSDQGDNSDNSDNPDDVNPEDYLNY